MTSHAEVDESNSRTGDPRGVSGTVVHVLIDLVRRRAGEIGVAQALALADDHRPFSDLDDFAAWSAPEETVALFNAAALVTGDEAIGLHVGETLMFTPDGTDFVDRLRVAGSPQGALTEVAALLGHFETTADATALEVAADHALVKVTPRSSPSRQPHLCEMTRGLLSEIPAVFGLPEALITEHECSARGGRFCLYSLSWDDGSRTVAAEPGEVTEATPPVGEGLGSPSPERRDNGRAEGHEDTTTPPRADVATLAERTIGRLNTELDQISVLLEGALSTTPELLDFGVEHLLSQIAARADAVITSPTYLLMVRVGPGTPIQLHHRGLDPARAQVLAAELWREHPDDADGSRLIADIASQRRRYGRVAVFHPPGTRSSASEERVLSLYADYAATALDIFSVVSAAKSSDATARALLSFSEALSHATTLSDSVQLLADTAPSVTGCDQAIVFLWDQEAGQLVPRAITGGTGSSSVRMGPIVPLTERGRSPSRRRVRQGRTDPAPGTADSRPPGYVPRGSRQPARSDVEQAARAHGDVVAISTDTVEFERVIGRREVVVLDGSTEDPRVRSLMEESGAVASVVAPFFAAGEFLGVVAANFDPGASTASVHDPDLHERLAGLADQAATAIWNLDLLEEVSHMAWHDALTGLPNRRLFEDRVDQELVRSRRVGEPVCMFFVDLDHFKTVNDTFGHAAGDDLIQQVGDRLTETVRSQDTVARVGGDEFAILLPGLADQLAIDQLAQRTLEALNEPFVLFGEEVSTSVSIGIAIAPEHGDTYDDLLNRADEAMYRAKDSGRNAFRMYSPPPDGTVRDRPSLDDRTMYTDLIHALENGEFFVLYQPYIDLKTAEVVGVEALVRWNHPTLGVLEPSSFITLAEKSDVIVALDSWVLAEACRQTRDWIDRGLEPLKLSVNLASRDLSSPDLFEGIRRTLEETGIDPGSLELEITERVVLDSSGPARDNIERLRRLGVRFAVDDFGLGNSSLSRIGSFPVSTLKIDRSFVQVLGPDGENNALVSAIISMADRLGLDCMAEGVETTLQSRVLFQRGCTTAQGYFFSPPLPAEEIERLLAEGPLEDHAPLDDEALLDPLSGEEEDPAWQVAAEHVPASDQAETATGDGPDRPPIPPDAGPGANYS